MEEFHLSDPDHNPTSSELERSVAKKANFFLQRWTNQALTKLIRRSSKFRRSECAIIQEKLLLSKKGSGMTFLPTNISDEILLKPKSQNWSLDWYVIMIKTKEKPTALFIGIRWVQNYKA